MQEQLIVFETAKLAKERGFDVASGFPVYIFKEDGTPDSTCLAGSSTIYRPTQSLLQKWLREVHKINVISWCNASGWAWEIEKTNGTHISIMDIDGDISGTIPDSGMFSSFEEALELGLQEALKLVEL